jgi:hypothetical protein
MKRAALLTALSFLFITGAFPEDWQAVVGKYGPAVGKIEIMDGQTLLESGTGFLIDGDGRLLTNAHVVADANFNKQLLIVVTFPSGATPDKKYTAAILKIDTTRDMDLALLKVDGRFPAWCVLSPDISPALMSDVLVIGFPLGKNFKATPGSLQAFQDMEGIGKMIDLSAAVDFGNSGGPVFGKDGKVIGIVTAKIFGFNFNLALPIGNALDFIAVEGRQIKVTLATTPDGARIILNGIYRGLSPLTLDLFRRDYKLLVEKDGFVSIEKTIAVSPNAADLKLELAPVVDTTQVKLTIATTPAGARVLINNSDLGKSPVNLTTTKGSLLRIKLLLDGYQDLYAEERLGDKPEQTLEYKFRR